MIYTQICEHGKTTISAGKETENCNPCNRHKVNEAFYVPNMTPTFNRGLGCMTSGTRDAEKIAKKRGLTPIGDAKVADVFKPKDNSRQIDKIIDEGRKKIHNLGSV